MARHNQERIRRHQLFAPSAAAGRHDLRRALLGAVSLSYRCAESITQPLTLLLWLPLIQIMLLWTAHLLLMRRFHLPFALVFLQATTILAMIFTTIYSAMQTEFGKGIVWKGRRYQFDALAPERCARRQVGHRIGSRASAHRWPAHLVRRHRRPIAAAAALLLLGWTVALLNIGSGRAVQVVGPRMRMWLAVSPAWGICNSVGRSLCRRR